jgi:hypothetical protein
MIMKKHTWRTFVQNRIQGPTFAARYSKPVGLTRSILSGEAVMLTCTANAAANVRGILSKDIEKIKTDESQHHRPEIPFPVGTVHSSTWVS